MKKTALITGIAITLYYLLLQWPNDPVEVTEYDQKDIIGNTIIDSNSITETVSSTSYPSLINLKARWKPIKPATPVTSIFINASINYLIYLWSIKKLNIKRLITI